MKTNRTLEWVVVALIAGVIVGFLLAAYRDHSKSRSSSAVRGAVEAVQDAPKIDDPGGVADEPLQPESRPKTPQEAPRAKSVPPQQQWYWCAECQSHYDTPHEGYHQQQGQYYDSGGRRRIRLRWWK